MDSASGGDFPATLAAAAQDVERVLADLLETAGAGEARLVAGMHYATLDGGKRLRPFLVLAAADLCGAARRGAMRTAAAVEMVHCYSLVHDDLPAMDDDDLRRGRPTVHKAFDDATAILVGDALLTLSFAVLADPATHPSSEVRCELVAELAAAAGARGMVGGQALDLAAETRTDLGLDAILELQRRKTGALIAFACEAGAILGAAPEAERAALRAYAQDLGLAFQIADDLLDAEGEEALVGKAVGKDQAAGKATFVSLLGLDGARQQAHRLMEQSCHHLESFGESADVLRRAARFVVERRA